MHLRGGLDVDNFCALAPETNIRTLIEEAERRLAAARDAERVADAANFPPLSLPRIDLEGIAATLSHGIPDLDASALERVQTHLASLGEGGEAWVGEGMKLADRLAEQGRADCPFCAQVLRSSPVLSHYRNYFGEAYDNLKSTTADVIRVFSAAHAGDVPAAFERTVRQIVERRAFWKAFAAVPPVEIDTAQIALKWKIAREGVRTLLEAKRAAPLENVVVPDEVRRAVENHNARCAEIDIVATELQSANANLEVVKEQAREANAATLAADLQRLRGVEARYDPVVSTACNAYLAEKVAKVSTERARRAARAALDRHRATAFPAYGVAINDFLQRFNASFRVGPVDAVNTRQGSSANYSLLVEGNPVPLSGPDGDQCFKNTLSSGDRNTLALAFFFASLQNDPARARKTVVIDDPMTSLDEHRTLHTLQEMDRLSREVEKMIVLSHSKPFLLGVWDKCQQLPRTALEVRRMGNGSTLASWDVNAAMISEHDRRYAAAVAYLEQADPATERRVAELLRPMLETFARVAYPAEFPPGSLFGPFHAARLRQLESHPRDHVGE